MNDPFLPRDPSDKKKVWPLRIDPVFHQRIDLLRRPIFIQIDPVIDDMQPLRLDVEEPFQVGFCSIRNGDDCVRHFERRLFEPDGEIVSAAKLLALPRPKRLERMDRDHQRKTVVQLREDPAKMAVPRVTMNEVGNDLLGVEIETALDRAEDRAQAVWDRYSASVETSKPRTEGFPPNEC